MRPDRPIDAARRKRALALGGIALLGVAGIVGSGGGGFVPPDDCPTGVDCNSPPPPPPPAADVQPGYVTALVGSAVGFTASVSHLGGTPGYQWSRSSDGGATYVDIAGATGPTYALAGVNLADDGAIFRVVALANGVSVDGFGRLVVSATPGWVFEDDEFQDADWLVSAVDDSNEPAPIHSEARLATGGNPGAYRKMVFTLPQGALSGRVFYTKPAAAYEPQSQGAIRVIDYAEDCVALQASSTTYTQSAMLIEQAGRRYLSNNDGVCTSTQWVAVAGRASLAAQDFRLFDGPACGAGEACPDFSARGGPMRFGYWRISFGVQGDSIAHGIDNWKVTVWNP